MAVQCWHTRTQCGGSFSRPIHATESIARDCSGANRPEVRTTCRQITRFSEVKGRPRIYPRAPVSPNLWHGPSIYCTLPQLFAAAMTAERPVQRSHTKTSYMPPGLAISRLRDACRVLVRSTRDYPIRNVRSPAHPDDPDASSVLSIRQFPFHETPNL